MMKKSSKKELRLEALCNLCDYNAGRETGCKAGGYSDRLGLANKGKCCWAEINGTLVQMGLEKLEFNGVYYLKNDPDKIMKAFMT